MSGEWVSARAVAWVIHEAPVPADLAWTLTVIAARCDENGRGSYQSTSTLAAKTGKSAKQAQRDVVRLRELGLLLLGDQSLTERLPPGKRPVVYDLPMHLSGPKPVKESRNKAGVKKAVEGAPGMDATPPMDGTPPSHGTPPMDAPSTPPMDVPGPLPSMGAKQSLNNPLNNPLSGPERQIVDAVEATPEEAREMIRIIKTDNPRIGSLSAYLATMAGNGTLKTLRDRVRAGERVPVPQATATAGPPPVDEYRAAVRNACEHGTPGGSGRCPLCRISRPAAPAAEVPQPRSDGSADRFIAELRARLGGGAGEPSPSRVE